MSNILILLLTYFFDDTVAKEDSLSQNPLENDTLRATLNSTEWDSDWDSDFSLHVQPLSDLNESSSDEELWENESQRRTTNQNTEERTRKRSDKTIAVTVNRKESKPGGADCDKGTQNEGAVKDGPRRSIAGEDRVRDRKTSRPVVKPIRRIGPGMKCRGRLTTLARSYMNGSLPFERTTEQNTGTYPRKK